jgi:hypothetical protein
MYNKRIILIYIIQNGKKQSFLVDYKLFMTQKKINNISQTIR